MSIQSVGEFHKPRKPCHQLAQRRYYKCAGVLQFFQSTGTPTGLRAARGHCASVSDGPEASSPDSDPHIFVRSVRETLVQEQDDAIRLVMLSFSLQVRHTKLWCLILLTTLDVGNSLQTPPFRLDRAVQKAADKLVEFSQHQENPTLVVDGNNVRGIAKFEWNPIERQH